MEKSIYYFHIIVLSSTFWRETKSGDNFSLLPPPPVEPLVCTNLICLVCRVGVIAVVGADWFLLAQDFPGKHSFFTKKIRNFSLENPRKLNFSRRQLFRGVSCGHGAPWKWEFAVVCRVVVHCRAPSKDCFLFGARVRTGPGDLDPAGPWSKPFGPVRVGWGAGVRPVY